jgi:Rrf2 family protein
MITREAEYAIRTVMFLARQYGKNPVSTMEISEAMDIPYRFLRKISHHLVEAGMIGAQRGKQGGIYLKIAPEKISLLNILELFDERAINLNICCKSGEACSRSEKCRIHDRLMSLQERLRSEFDAFRISDLVD